MPRKTSPRVATSLGCAPLRAMYRAAEKRKPSRWPEVEKEFLQAMWDFDQKFASGEANQGDNQNGKGDFFTDLIALLLENCSDKSLYGRGSVPGLIFTGWVPRERVGAYFRVIDLGLIPFEENALTHAAIPIKALEYGAYGKPVVASRLKGLLGLQLSHVECQPLEVDTWCHRIEELLRQAGAPPASAELDAYRWDALAKNIEQLFV